MTPATHLHVLTACFHFLPALVWAVIAERFWYRVRVRPEGPVFRFLTLLSVLMAVHFIVHGAIELTPNGLGIPWLHSTFVFAIGVCVVGASALFRHLVPLLAIRETPPSRRWLLVHYGIAVLVLIVDGPIRFFLYAGNTHPWLFSDVYFAVVFVGLSTYEIRRLARRGEWPWQFDAGFLTAIVAVPGILIVAVVLGLGNVLLAPVFIGDNPVQIQVPLLGHTAFGLVTAAPFAAMMLGEVLRSLLVATGTLATAAFAYLALPAAIARVASPEARVLADVGTIALLGLLLPSGRVWLGRGIDRVFFRQSRRARAELQAFVHTLAPELGPLECCRRAVDEVMRVMQPRGAAILLAGGAAARSGAFDLAPLERVWPTTAATPLPTRAFSLYAIRDPSLREALAAADADIVVPVISPRGRRGDLFVSEGLLARASQAEQHVETLEAFATQLALVLDAADLLARAVAVERTLAHAEKLAAIGETAARIAHEIRNPVTAARSLAQQLTRDPTAAVNAEHAQLILAELERVERQVAALLRFSRREDFRFEPVDLGELVRATLAQFRPRLEAAGVALDAELPGGITPLADREKLRQVLVNLLENALDALRDASQRRLVLAVGTDNGSATLSVRDSGPGVPAEALPRLFEPFFSLKDGGTGLGLAIAKRTIEAHGGRIDADPGIDTGLGFRVALPLAAGQSSPARGTSGSAAVGGRTS